MLYIGITDSSSPVSSWSWILFVKVQNNICTCAWTSIVVYKTMHIRIWTRWKLKILFHDTQNNIWEYYFTRCKIIFEWIIKIADFWNKDQVVISHVAKKGLKNVLDKKNVTKKEIIQCDELNNLPYSNCKRISPTLDQSEVPE